MLYSSSQEQDELMPLDSTEVDIPMGIEEMMASDDGVVIDPTTGEIEEEGEMTPNLETLPFGTNLAEYLPEEELDEIGDKIKTMVEADKETRKEWYTTLKKGFEALGIYDADDTSDAGLRRVTHPLLLEAATQFQARAMSELLPPGGPVKTMVIGEQTPEVLAQGKRVEEFMNYQLTVEDRTYYDERDQMLFLLGFTGSEFDKQYFNAAKNKVDSKWVRCDHFIVPYDAKNLETASRYTHEIHMEHNDYRRAVAAGMYTDEVMDRDDAVDETDLEATVKKLGGQIDSDMGTDDAKVHVFYETHIDYDLPGSSEDIALPYIITVDSVSGKVVGLYRNWKESDPLRNKRVWFTHKKFLPGFGFYGFGLLHCIGNLGEAATEILRVLLDSGAFATLQGGFKSKDCRLKGDVELEPGVWIDTEMTSDELQKSFYTPPFKEPSQVLEKLLGTLVDAGQKFAATTETMTGDAATTGPVGTMVAQIEQGSKVFSGIHKRLHKSFGDEFIHIAELNGEYLPDVYPYRATGSQTSGSVLREDFDGRVDCIPVSDPNIFSSAQRLAIAQSIHQLANSMPDIADRREAAVGLLTALRAPSPEKYFPKKQEAVRMDPVTEGAMVVMGKPVKAYLDQNHPAHISTHQFQTQQMPKERQGMMVAHIQEHMAMAHYMQFTQMGTGMPQVNWYPETGQPMYPPIPPDIENQIAVKAAQGVQQLQQQQQQAEAAKQPQPAPAPAQVDPAVKFQEEQKLKDAAFQADQQRKGQALAAQVDREDALAGLSPQLVKQADEFVKANNLQMSPRELAVLSKALGKPFDEVIQAISRMQMGGQGAGPVPVVTGFNNRDPRFS